MPTQTYSRAELTRFFISCLAGFLAGHLTNYTVILFAQDVWQRDALAGAGFALCFGVPLLLGWPAGAWCDQYSPQRIAQIAHGAFFVALALLAAASHADTYGVALYLLGAGSAGIGWSLLAPARMALLGRMAGARQAKLAVVFNLFVMLGFGLAPLLLAFARVQGGWTAVQLCGLGLFSLATLMLVGLKVPALGGEGHVFERVRQGFRYARSSTLLGQALLTAVLIYLAMGPIQVMLPRFAQQTLQLGEMQRGMFLGALALAFLIGGAIALPLAKHFGQGRVLLLAAVISGGGLILLGNSETLATALLFLGLNGICAGVAISLVVALLQQESEAQFRGRLLSIYTVTSQVIPAAGGLGAGLLLEVLPASQGLLLCGAVLSCLFLAAAWRLRLLRAYG
ncbi:Transmembrane secretion effector [Pseudomonas pohangensis]|uniref:Transmembrane secretion effector n=1 Tax=Pseudomonas pohangensis TaxID=364197 RepID=A0A1H2I1P0_9PSED|nr:MFS transporter [Pseudomonas pohangensis]SDU37969.1 Transmembrane secretion effector [Pseudomonas pohangensis]